MGQGQDRKGRATLPGRRSRPMGFRFSSVATGHCPAQESSTAPGDRGSRERCPGFRVRRPSPGARHPTGLEIGFQQRGKSFLGTDFVNLFFPGGREPPLCLAFQRCLDAQARPRIGPLQDQEGTAAPAPRPELSKAKARRLRPSWGKSSCACKWAGRGEGVAPSWRIPGGSVALRFFPVIKGS